MPEGARVARLSKAPADRMRDRMSRHRLTRVRLFCSALALVSAATATAQIVPWLETTEFAAARPERAAPVDGRRGVRREEATPANGEKSGPARRTPRRDDGPARAASADPTPPVVVDPRDDAGIFSALMDPSPILLSGFSGGSTDGAVRSGTTWVGQTTQHADTLSVGGTARDDNGWGATRLSVDASAMLYLNITAQRDAGHAAPTLFIQFEDLSLQTKVISVGTSHFALGMQTLVQVPLTGWTIDFGPGQITSWSLGGGSVGTTDFRMTFDSLSFTATAIPEPAGIAAIAAAAALFAAVRRRNRWRPS